jgi:hypothetical protein
MKRVLIHLILLGFCAPLSFGAFDYTISTTYNYGINLIDQSLLVTGVGSLQIMARGSSYIEVQNTAPLQQFVGGIYALLLNDNSTLNFYRGELGSFRIYDDSTAVFEGGRIDYISSYQYVYWWNGQPVDQHIEMIVKNYSYNTSTKKLTGTWADNTTFNIQLYNQTGYDTVINNIKFTIIPEPATVLLLGLGSLLMRKR